MNRFKPQPRFGKRRAPVYRTGSLGPALEIGRTRLPAFQYRKSNPGRTPDRSLSLKQPGFMRVQGERFQRLARGRNSYRTADNGATQRAWPSPLPIPWRSAPGQEVLANSGRRAYGKDGQDEPEGGPAMTCGPWSPFGSNARKPRQRPAARGTNCKSRPK